MRLARRVVFEVKWFVVKIIVAKLEAKSRLRQAQKRIFVNAGNAGTEFFELPSGRPVDATYRTGP